MGFKDFLPFQVPVAERKSSKLVKMDQPKKIAALMKSASLALGLTDTYGLRHNIRGTAGHFASSPFDFDQITRAIDTDSYVKQAFAKYQELMWKEGYEIVGENTQAVAYILERFDFLELAMRMPVTEFFKTTADQLCKFHNAVLAKVRNPDIKKVFPGPLEGLAGQDPIVGYEIIPIETVRIQRDIYNRPVRYRQELEGYGGVNQPKAPEWDASEIIHLTVDKRPGYIFGTPFMTAAIEDIIALRTMEEDIQNLVHQELFPIIDVTVGTPENPGDDEEVIAAADEIDHMKHDGALIHSERRKIEIIGSQGAALDATEYLHASMERVAIGLGLHPHHLGMTFGGGNRAMTQQHDIALYDRIKTYQRYYAAVIQLFIMNELLREGGFDPLSNPVATGISDRCIFKFREIDTETRIQKESHTVNLWANNLITQPEARLDLGLDPEMDESETFAALTARMTPDVVSTPAPAKPGLPKPPAPQLVDTTSPHAKKDTQTPSTGGTPNSKNTRRGIGNTMKPANQHGRKLAPNVKHSDDAWLEAAEFLKGIEDGE